MKSGMVRSFFYVKYCMVRAQSHYAFIAAPAQQFAILLILLKSFGINPSLVWIAFGYGSLVIIMAIVGHLDIKHGFAKVEHSIVNEQNQQFLEIHRRVTGGE